MFKKIKNMHYKKLFLYGFYGSFISITSLAFIIDMLIKNYFDAMLDITSVTVAAVAFAYYLKTDNRELASIMLFWIVSGVVFLFVIFNDFDISIIYTLLIPMVAFILLSRQKILIHVTLYFILLSLIFAYAYMSFDTNPFLFTAKHMSAYFIATLFVIAFGFFYHIAIERSYSALELANQQKIFLLKEIHHRVKNNLNIIASILGLQKLESDSLEVHRLIDQNRLRLESIAMAHEILYKQEDLEHINFQAYVEKLASHILKAHSHENSITINIVIELLRLSIEDVIQLGIIINELMTNSIKYAFSEGKGAINISLKRNLDGYLFCYGDNGRGLKDADVQRGFGFSLVEMSVEQLAGKLTVHNTNGLQYEVQFKGETVENLNRRR